MTVGRSAWRKTSIVVGCLLLALPLSFAQKRPAENSPGSTRSVLIDKARALESRGRPDMAAQLWQQILLSEPNNPEALAGLARDYKLMGNAARAGEMLDRLRRIDPNDPNLARIQSLSSTQSESEQLHRAGELARQGRAEDSVRIYRQLYGDNPPDNDIAMAYYQTLYATATGKTSAVAGMRGLVQRYPANQRFSIALGAMLSYDPRTRAEGIHILEGYPKDAEAQSALRQALIWNAANPATANQLRQYLKSHPEDAEVASNLKANERKLVQMNTGVAHTSGERAAFAALNAHRLDEAQSRFDALLRQQPNNGRVLAGIGFLRMQQRNFDAAISFLSQAEQNGYKVKAVEDALETSRFWDVMGEATQAFNDNRFDVASARYRAALVMNARSADALNGLAGVLIKQQQYAAAAGVYEQLLAVQPMSEDGWRGLFLAYASDKQFTTALATSLRFPEKVKAALAKDPEYLRTLAAVYQAQNRSDDAERVLAQALALPFPNNGTTLKADTKLQYAGILMQARRYTQAIPLYTQVLADNSNNVSAWMGLVGAYHELGQDTQAVAELKKMPPSTYESALADPSFLAMLGAIYQRAGQFDTAQGLLERAAKIEIAAGGQPSMALQLQLAGIYLARNNSNQAITIYQRVVVANPERADAWKCLIGALLATGRNADALNQVAAMPTAVRAQLDDDIEFDQSLASLYDNNGDTANAIAYMNRVQAYYAKRNAQPPANIEVQNAWLLYNTGDDRGLYGSLMRLGSRSDLSAAQREAIQNIWINWSVRRAEDAFDNGNSGRAVDILDAALQAFPDNPAVRKAVAGGYARVGRARESLKIFKALNMQDATASDYQGAIGAALAANDKTQTEAWLRIALDRFSSDAGILSLAARYEQSRGDNQRAAAYWRAALAAMPASTPADKLANELVHPEQNAGTHRTANGTDLKQLLNPDNDQPNSTRLPAPPRYAPDPRPVIGNIPSAQPANPQLFHQQSAVRFGADKSGADQSTSGAWAMRDGVYHPSVAGSPLRPANGWTGSTMTPRLLRASLAPGQAPDTWDSGSIPIVANPPHSMATDAWKGLITSLIGAHRNAEALAELARIPSDARRQLESDIEFVQAVAKLYLAANDSAHAYLYLSRVEKYYAQNRSASPANSGTVNLPRSERTIEANEPESHDSATTMPAPPLRITSQPMGDQAARAQAQFAAQTDSQLTQGSAAVVHALPNATVNADANQLAAMQVPADQSQVRPALDPVPGVLHTQMGDYTSAQYTPSAQEAATGAYSVPRTQLALPPEKPAASAPSESTAARRRRITPPPNRQADRQVPTQVAIAEPPAPPLSSAPAAPVAPSQQAPQSAPAQAGQSQPAQTGTGATDEQLQERNLPPLRGPWSRTHGHSISPREEAELRLRTIEGGYSGWLGGTGFINYRSGALGYDHLAALEAPFEASLPMGPLARFTIVAKPVFLDSGQSDGTSIISVLKSTTSGTALATIPQPIGTLAGANIVPPAQQNAMGVGGEVQLVFPQFAIAAGYTPYGFLVSTFTGRLMWKPANGPITITAARDSQKDSQLSYAGLRDPAGNTLATQGQIWGGVIANQGNLQYAHGDEQSGFYFNVGGQYLTGYNVVKNQRIDGNGGAYWRMKRLPEYGDLNIGINFFAMHYAKNENAFTHGMGGYFSPQGYFLANVPFTFTGHYNTSLHYNVTGGFGVQAFQENKTKLWPLAGDQALEVSQGNPMLPDHTSVGPNYDLHGQLAYQIGPHWFAGGFFNANNTRNYSSASAGFSIHYMFRAQPSSASGPTGLFPSDGLRPFTVP